MNHHHLRRHRRRRRHPSAAPRPAAAARQPPAAASGEVKAPTVELSKRARAFAPSSAAIDFIEKGRRLCRPRGGHSHEQVLPLGRPAFAAAPARAMGKVPFAGRLDKKLHTTIATAFFGL